MNTFIKITAYAVILAMQAFMIFLHIIGYERGDVGAQVIGTVFALLCLIAILPRDTRAVKYTYKTEVSVRTIREEL